MTEFDIPPETTEQLLSRMEATDRKYRRFQGFFALIVGLLLVLLVGGQYYQIQKGQDQSAQRAAGISKILDGERAENAKQTRFIQCLAQFFATTDRQTRVLKDLDNCNIQKNGEQVPGVDLTPTVAATPNTPALSVAGSGNSPQSNTSPQPVDNSGGTQPAGNPVQITTPLPGPLNSIPLCVEVLGLCVR